LGSEKHILGILPAILNGQLPAKNELPIYLKAPGLIYKKTLFARLGY